MTTRVHDLLQQKRGSGFHFVIVGCGPAGLSSAISLQRAGFHTLLIERSLEIPAGAAWSNQRWLHSGEFYLFTIPDIAWAKQYSDDLRRGAELIKRWARGNRISVKGRRPSIALARTERDLRELISRQKQAGIESRQYSESAVRGILPIRPNTFVGAVETQDTPINPPNMYRALVEKFVHEGGVIWLGAELDHAEEGFVTIRPTLEARVSGGVREYRQEGIHIMDWTSTDVTFAHRLIYACGYGLASLCRTHFPGFFDEANQLRLFAATKLFGRVGSRAAVAYVADPHQLHPPGFALVEHGAGRATLCSTSETLELQAHLGNQFDFETVVKLGEEALRDLCKRDLAIDNAVLTRFIAQRCTKIDVHTPGDASRKRANVLLEPSDWQLVILAGKATLSPLLGEDVKQFALLRHPHPAKLPVITFPYLSRMPGDMEMGLDEAGLKDFGSGYMDQS